MLLAALDAGVGLTGRLAARLGDRRQFVKVRHYYGEMFRQRVFGIAMGYEDGNDAARIANDPVFKEACGREAVRGERLASQPSLSRFENAITGRDLVSMGRELEDFVIERHAKRLGRKARVVTIDLDGTEDPTHGQQPFAFFNGFYDSWCYLPSLGFLSFDDEPEQFLFHARLRPGTAKGWRAVLPLLYRTVPKLKESFPKARIRVRLDAGFACPRMFELLEELGVEYVVAMAGNTRLLAAVEPFLAKARVANKASGESERVYGEVSYAAETWPHERRVVVKAEVLAGEPPRDNPRFTVTNSRRGAQFVYEDFYCARGDSENRIKELQRELALGRTSCSSFLANQLRVLEAATAYVLYQELRLRVRRTELGRAQVGTIRVRLLKVAVTVVQSVRRLVFHFPAAYPWKDLWQRVALAVGAVPG